METNTISINHSQLVVLVIVSVCLGIGVTQAINTHWASRKCKDTRTKVNKDDENREKTQDKTATPKSLQSPGPPPYTDIAADTPARPSAPHAPGLLGLVPMADYAKPTTSIFSVENFLNTDNSKAPGKRERPICFRVSQIPSDWDESQLRQVLHAIDNKLKHENIISISICKACVGRSNTALITLMTKGTTFFNNIPPDKSVYSYENLEFDRHFIGLTALATPENIVADIVAVTGLAGHAYGSWCSRETNKMWLKDFLPKDITTARIMTFGYNSSLTSTGQNDSRLIDYQRTFMQQLENARSSDLQRPIIFIAHSLGGILVLRTLMNSLASHLLRSTKAIFFFGVPLGGLRTSELENMVDEEAASKHSAKKLLLQQLRHSSDFLEESRESILSVFQDFQGKIISFYETKKTRTVKKSRNSESFSRDGLEVMMVETNSAFLNLSQERRFPISEDHTNMVKFPNQNTVEYHTVANYILSCIKKNLSLNSFISICDHIEPQDVLEKLSAVSKPQYQNWVSSQSRPTSKEFWVFQNEDYKEWASSGPPTLWLGAETKAMLTQVCAAAVNALQASTSRPGKVLYFFCGSKEYSEQLPPRNPIKLIHTLVSQLVELAGSRKNQQRILSGFLSSLIDQGISSMPPFWLMEGDSPDHLLSKLLDLPVTVQWLAFRAAVNISQSIDSAISLSIIIDDMVEFPSSCNEQEHQICEELHRISQDIISVRVLVSCTSLLPSMKDWLKIQKGKEVEECLQSLRVTNNRYEKIQSEHSGSLEWLWTNKQYKSWSELRGSSFFICQGKPGSGKSVITRYYRRNMLERDPLVKDATVAQFFYSWREGNSETSHIRMLCAVLFDILEQNDTFFFHYQKIFRKTQGNWTYETLRKVLLSFSKHPVPERIFIVLDALDESVENGREDVIETFSELCHSSKNAVFKVFASSRPIDELELLKLYKNSALYTIRMQDMNATDIRKYADNFLQKFAFPEEVMSEAREIIFERAQGVFLWVRFIGDQLEMFSRRGFSPLELFEELKALPDELKGLYKRMLEEVKGSPARDMKISSSLFPLITFARRPFDTDELGDALVIPNDPKIEFSYSRGYLQKNRIIQIENRIRFCGGNFIEVKKAQGRIVVQLMHDTVREFLSSDVLRESQFHIKKVEAHARISIVCLRYLIILCGDVSSTLVPGTKTIDAWTQSDFEYCTTFLQERYLTSYILFSLRSHLEEGQCKNNEFIKDLIKEVMSLSSTSLFSDLFEAQLHQQFGGFFEELADETIMITKKDININLHSRLLHTAARLGQAWAVKTFLQCGANIEFCINEETPLEVAVRNGHELTVRTLLNSGANISVEKVGTLLHIAIKAGFPSLIAPLSTAGFNINHRDINGKAPLHIAAEHNQVEYLDSLIQAGAQIDILETKGTRQGTPLITAARYGHLDIAERLISAGSDLESYSLHGYTALLMATYYGQISMVKFLIEKGANKNAQSEFGRNCLHWAAACNHPELTELFAVEEYLLEGRCAAERTPVHYAVQRCADRAMPVLVAAGCSMDVVDCQGNTPLDLLSSWITNPRSRRSRKFVKFLLDSGAAPQISIKNHAGDHPAGVQYSQKLSDEDVRKKTAIAAFLVRRTAFLGGGTTFLGGGTTFLGGGITFLGGGITFLGGGTAMQLSQPKNQEPRSSDDISEAKLNGDEDKNTKLPQDHVKEEKTTTNVTVNMKIEAK